MVSWRSLGAGKGGVLAMEVCSFCKFTLMYTSREDIWIDMRASILFSLNQVRQPFLFVGGLQPNGDYL